jgi:hypothetical protein
MFKTMLISAAVAFFLAGCATGGDIKSGVSSLVGQPVQKAIDRLGPPTSKTEDGGETTYVWMTNQDVAVTTDDSGANQQTSRLGVQDPNEALGNVSSSTTTTTNHRCFVRVVAGADGKIKDTASGGNADGCAAYASRLG